MVEKLQYITTFDIANVVLFVCVVVGLVVYGYILGVQSQKKFIEEERRLLDEFIEKVNRGDYDTYM